MLASIIIVTYNSGAEVGRCVESVFEYTKDVPFELIFVDNASSDGTPEYLSTVPQAQVVANAENRGFAGGCNQGLQLAQGDYLVLLNPDTVVTKGWLRRLIAHAERFPDVGAVGPMSNHTGELQLDALAEAEFEDLAQMQVYAQRVAADHRGKAWEFHRVAGFCVLLKREVVERVGNLDEQFGIGFFEDDDYSKRIRKAGYRLLIAGDVFVYHEGGTSFSALTPGLTDQLMLINRMRYMAKWSDVTWFTEIPTVELPRPVVSVITATRDRPHLLRAAVASVLAQTFENFELLVVNDGDQDLSAMLEEFADDRIRLLSSTGNGKSRALNVGLDAARGQFIAYLDDDDLYYPWHLKTLVSALLNRPTYRLAYADTVVGYCFAGDDGHRLTTSNVFGRWEYDRAQLREQNYIPNLAIMHSRSLIDQAGGYDEELPLYEDWDALRRFSSFTDFLHVPVIAAEWHRHPNMSSRNEPSLQDTDLREDALHYIKAKLLPWPGKPTVHDLVAAGGAAEGSGLLEVAVNSYFAALDQDPLSFEAGLGAARVLRSLGRRSRVRTLLRNVIKSRPDIAEGYTLYAQELLRKRPSKEQVLEAKEALEFALLVDPGRSMGSVYRFLADCYSRLNRRQSAQACRDHARRRSPHGRIGRFVHLWRREGLEVALGRSLRAVAPELSALLVRFEASRRGRDRYPQ